MSSPSPAGVSRPHILFVTGTRADYGKIKAIMRAVRDRPEDFDYSIFVTGMHLLKKYGSTWLEIEKDGFTDTFLHFNQDHYTAFMMDRVLADTVTGLSHYVAENKVDLLVVHGDRVEALAGAIVGSLNGILVGHIEGGELSGTVDEVIRHTITKLAHLHFVSNQEARERIIRMGEYPDKVHVIGSPNVDIMLSDDLPSIESVRDRYEIDDRPFGLLALHPVVGESDGLYERTLSMLEALDDLGRYFVALYPNNDPGSEAILAALRRFEDSPRFRMLPSMKFEYYLAALRTAAVIVGNSSSGIHEAPVYGVPSVNIGDRQRNRFSHTSIRDVPFDAQRVAETVDRVWGERHEPAQHFGTGGSAGEFIRILGEPSTWETRVLKQFED